ncbi:hypothetical protein HK097_002876, partial [Rhizophlyctis rosea]
MEPIVATPRVNSAHLANFRGKTVRLVGRVLAVNGSNAILEAGDQGQVTVNFVMSGNTIMQDTVVEVLGRVENDLSVQELSTAHFAQWDPVQYTKMVNLAMQNKDLFG